MGFLDHRELKIIKGIPTVIGTTQSVEAPLVVMNLMDRDAGISLISQDAWSPKIPGIEGNGIWSDSPLSPGRVLISAVEGNVIETMRLVITGSSLLAMIKTLDSLYAIANDARGFWTDNAQINPVYLKWWASCGQGPQYALIYNITIEPVFLDSANSAINATITIERETYWRWLPPGANPKQWRYEFYNQAYDFSHSRLDDFQTDHLIQTPTLQNKSEFTSGAFTALLSNNCITIDSSLIPGDAPALMTFYTTVATGRPNIIVGKKTVRITPFNLATAQNAIFNFADGLLGTNATIVADTGASIRASTGAADRVEIGFGTATNALRWNANSGTNGTTFQNRFIGRWMVFLRCRQSAGAVGDITMYLRVGVTVASDSDGQKLNVVSPPVIAGAGNTTVWGLVYMGVISIPLLPAKTSQNGANTTFTGINVSAADLDFGLFALRSAGVGLLYLNDLILIPIDEGSMSLEAADGTASGAMAYDETGFLSHGTPDIVVSNGMPSVSANQLAKMTGTGIQLTPNTENKLYFVFYDSSLQSSVADTMKFEINIIPRSRGIRDRANING